MSNLRENAARFGILAAIQGVINDATAEARARMSDDLRALHAESGATSANVEVPGLGKVGKVTLPENQDAVKVVDEKAYTEWVEVHAPDEVEWVPVVRSSFRDGHLKALKADGGADYDTGLVVDVKRTRDNDGVAVVVAGVEAVKGRGFKSPSLTGLKKDEIVAAIRSKSILELTAAPEEAPQAVVVEGEVLPQAPIPSDDELKAMKRPEILSWCDIVGVEKVGTLAQLRTRIGEARDADEILPGVTRAEATAAAVHACTVQGGFSTPEIEAERIAKDRARAATRESGVA